MSFQKDVMLVLLYADSCIRAQIRCSWHRLPSNNTVSRNFFKTCPVVPLREFRSASQ